MTHHRCVQSLALVSWYLLFASVTAYYLLPSYAFWEQHQPVGKMWTAYSETSAGNNVKALVRWATGKRLTNRLPKLSLITLSPLWTAGFLVFVWGRTCLLRSSIQSLGTQGERFIRFLTWGNSLFFGKRFHGGREIRTHNQRPMVLPTTPFVKALVRWATGKRLNNRLPKLSLITCVRREGCVF